MKIFNRMVAVFLSGVISVLLVACEADHNSSEAGNGDFPSYTSFEPYVTSVGNAELPMQGIIALGEATHGNKEFTELKLEVFKKLVEQSGIRAFALEADFGGGQKVNQYIHGGDGTAAQAASEIGFEIYKTEEMVQILNWMRKFNSGRDESTQIRFYGYDMQRYDNNKEELFAILEQAAPELKEKYSDALAGFTDEIMFDIEESLVTSTIATLEALNKELEEENTNIVAVVGKQQSDLAMQYAECILENTKLRIADNYGTLRDQYMAEHVQWINDYEANYYSASGIFIAGHNGHIGKTTATVGTEKAMGQILSEVYGESYYAIGTEFGDSNFLSQNDSGERKEFTVENKGGNRLAVILSASNEEIIFLDLDTASKDSALSAYLEEKQAMSSIGDYFSEPNEKIEAMYTQQLSPVETYDALIYVGSANYSTMLNG